MVTASTEQINSFPIGMVSANTGDFHENEITLSPGDRMYIYSDGFDEQATAEQEQFGEERLREWCAKQANESAENIAEKLYDHLLTWSQSDGLKDDASLIVIERND